MSVCLSHHAIWSCRCRLLLLSLVCFCGRLLARQGRTRTQTHSLTGTNSPPNDPARQPPPGLADGQTPDGLVGLLVLADLGSFLLLCCCCLLLLCFCNCPVVACDTYTWLETSQLCAVACCCLLLGWVRVSFFLFFFYYLTLLIVVNFK